MTTYLEALPASKTHGTHRRVRWTPHPAAASCSCDGTLEISQGKTGRDSVTYALTEFPVGAGFGAGRAVRLDKADGSESYGVFVAADGRHHQCDCAGFAYGRGKPCKHIDGVQALLDNGWLADPRGNGEADHGPTETAEQIAPDLGMTESEYRVRCGGRGADLDAF
jgi:hypothetical protein